MFTNELGYDKILYNNNAVENSNFFVNFNHQFDYLLNSNDLKEVNNWTNRVIGDSLAYRLNDPNQPNQLLYLRINFPSTILNVVLIITIFIAAIIVLLTIIFIFILMRSIIRQNLNTFAVGMANGISKRKLLFSFMPFVLIPSSISALIGYTLSFFIYPLISNAIQDYWILDYIRFSFSIGYLIFAFIIITLIIFAVQSIVVYSILNKNVSSLLVAKLEFKYNKLVQMSHKTVSKLRPLSSFRITYMLGNFGRLLLLLLMMTSFVSLTTISASTTSTFNTAIQKTVDNKQYNYAIDLYTPTEQGGYYYNVPYNLLGTRQQGLTSLYDLNSTTGFYTTEYKDDLTYNIPNTNESIVYENLFLPSASLVSDIQGNLLFFKNKVVHVSTMNFGINFIGNYINPWEWAKKIIPTSISNTIKRKFQQQLNYAFAYVLWAQDKANNPDKDMWMYNKTDEYSFVKDLNNSLNPEEWNQSNWIFQYIKENGAYSWKTNEQIISTGLPNFTMTQSAVYFVTRLLSFSSNSYYKEFVRELETSKDIKVQDNNFMLALNVIPFIENKDETYTYIDATTNFIDSDIKIYGIKPNSEQVILWDEYNGLDLKERLQDYENDPNNSDKANNIYPLIINEVVAKKYRLGVNREIQIKVNNKYNRFTRKFNNIENSDTYRFRILGITTSKSEEQYYTTQNVANKLLEFKTPELANQFDLDGKNYDYKWVNQEEIDNFIPFNGVFSKQELPKMLSNFATLYSPSGLSPISGSLPTGEMGDTYSQIFNNYSEINKILKINIIDENNGKSFETISQFCRDYENLFNTDKYFNSALTSIDVKFTSSLIGSVMDSTLGNINLICILSLLP
ncbi:MAG: hypothetical protein K2L64_01470, partial [Ureaplasma sp.]|nr:hypothetical protein [Ureaplasma sp.]